MTSTKGNAPSIFDGEGYNIWEIQMEAYLDANDLWKAVEEDFEIDALPVNASRTQVKNYRDRKIRNGKAKASLFAAVSIKIFTEIMSQNSAKSIWDYLKSEFEGDDRRVMNDSETIKEYSERLSKFKAIEKDMERKSPRRQPTKKQPIKLMANLKKMSDLNLREKVDLMKGSVFCSLSTVSNKRESSGTLVATICKYYDASKKLFVLNNETYFGFCSKEVTDILGMEDKGIDYKDYVKQCSELPAEFPCYLKELRERFVSGRDTNGAIMSSHLKDILRNMTVDDAESKQHFRELMSYYLVEQVLLCSSNAKKPCSSMWRLINNLGTFETVNWAKATLNQLHSSLSHTKIWLEGGSRGQHSFMGVAPVLEKIIYERIPSMRPSKWSKDSPPVQKYASQRKNEEKWIETKLIKLTPNDIEMCPHCAASSGSHFMAAKDVTPGSFAENTNCSAEEEEVENTNCSAEEEEVDFERSEISGKFAEKEEVDFERSEISGRKRKNEAECSSPNTKKRKQEEEMSSKRGWNNTAAASNAIPPPRPTEDAEDRKILWPPMVVIMNTFCRNENGKDIGIGNQELLDYFESYKPDKAHQSYGPHGHKGMSLLSFKKSAEGFANAERLSKYFESKCFGRNAWSNDARELFSNGKYLLYGYLATAKDMDFFNRSLGKKKEVKFTEVLYQEMPQTTEAEENPIEEDSRDHEEQKKMPKLKGFFTRLDNMTVEQISNSAKQWACPLCTKGSGSNKKFHGVQALVQHAKKNKKI